MGKYRLTKAERETIILWDEKDRMVRIEVFDTKLKNDLAKAARDYPDTIKCLGTDQYGGISYELPRSLLSVKIKKPMSEEKRKEMSERGKKGYYALTSKIR